MKKKERAIAMVFGLLVLAGLVLGIRQGASEKEATEKYAAGRGWSLLTEDNSLLTTLLAEALPQNRWSLNSVISVERGSEMVFLFAYQASKSNRGHACLAQRVGGLGRVPLTILTRIPGFGSMVDHPINIGAAEFLKQFFVSCGNSEVAESIVNPAVQRILLEHSENPGWFLEVTVSARAVLVASSWAKTEQDWDHLIQLAKKLRTAVPPPGGGI
jgi:hypothetical protein